jgi:hypothetical protein
VGCHQLLLLADRRQEAQRVGSEAGDPQGCHRGQSDDGSDQHSGPLPPAGAGEYQERQQQARRELHADASCKRQRGGPRPGCPLGCRGAQRQRQCEEHDQDGVVVRAADGQHQQYGVEPQEGGGEGGGAPEALRGAGGQPDGGEAAEAGQGLEGPQPTGGPERHGRIAGQREQGPVGRVLEGPADEAEDGVGGGFGGEVGVGVETVQGTHPREGRIAEDVL